MFAYCENNPVNYLDPDGMCLFKQANGSYKLVTTGCGPTTGPNSRHDTIDAAAIDFVNNYNAMSISSKREYTATIKKIVVGGKTIYTYGEPGIGPVRTGYSGQGAWAPGAWDGNVVAYVHTHGHYYGSLNDLFSQEDLDIANKMRVYAYVGTPRGTVRKYDPWNPGKWDRANGFDRGFQIFGKAPYDPNHPSRR